MPAVLQLVLTLPSLTFRSAPVWLMNYMVTLPVCRTKPGFLKLGTIDGLGLDIHSLFFLLLLLGGVEFVPSITGCFTASGPLRTRCQQHPPSAVVTTKKAPRHCYQMFPGGQNCPHCRTPGLSIADWFYSECQLPSVVPCLTLC